MKKYLYITHLSGRRLNRIWLSAIIAAQNRGYEVHLACNMENAAHPGWDDDCKSLAVYTHQIDFDRNPLGVSNIRAIKQLLDLMRIESFDIVHCNTPVGGLLGRICAHECRVPCVIYQAHGFHFWKGAPIKNWILYYPIERAFSKYTDILITITKDDYEIAKRMKAKSVKYVHGVGVDLSVFERREDKDRNQGLRSCFGIPKNSLVLLSVGELNSNKNHGSVIQALAKMKKKNVYYVICGEGILNSRYNEIAKKLNVEDRLIFAGFCTNIYDYYRMADLLVFPSFREGLPTSIMEAMATGTPVVASDIRGIRDIITERKYRFNPKDINEIARTIEVALDDYSEEDLDKNIEFLKEYDFNSVVKELQMIYSSSGY